MITRRKFVLGLAGVVLGPSIPGCLGLKKERDPREYNPMADFSRSGMQYYVKGNPAGRDTVFIHGLAEQAEDWYKVIRLLPENHCYAVSLPGFGKSCKPKGDYTTKQAAVYMADFISELKLEHPMLVADSRGCAVALRLAAKKGNPAGISSMVLCSAHIDDEHTKVNKPKEEQILYTPFSDLFLGLARIFGGRKNVADNFQGLLKGRTEFSDADVERHYDVMKTREGFGAFISAVKHLDLEVSAEEFEQIQENAIPHVFLWGEHDKLIEVQTKKYYIHFRMQKVEGSGHLIHFEKPEAVAECVRKMEKRIKDEEKWKSGIRF